MSNFFPITLSLLSWPDGEKSDNRRVTDRCRIGRGRESCDWTLPDGTNAISRLHCEVIRTGCNWRLIDHSRNGTFLENETVEIGSGRSRELTDGSRFRLGDYLIEVRYASLPAAEAESTPQGSEDGESRRDVLPPPPSPGAKPNDAGCLDYQANPLFGDWSGRPPAASPEIGGPSAGQSGWPSPALAQPVGLPADWDSPLSPSQDQPPMPVPAGAASHTPFPLPSDWDQPGAPQQSALSLPAGGDSPGTVTAAIPTPPSTATAGHRTETRHRAPANDALVAAFLRGAGLDDVSLKEPERIFEQVGAALRAMVSGIDQGRKSRNMVKREFRIVETTYFSPTQDNPLRMMLGEDETLRSILTGRFDMAKAIGDVLSQMNLHELALITAMRDAVENLLMALSPRQVEQTLGGPAEGGVLPDLRRARAWKAYQAMHAQTLNALRDDFDSVFGKAFARAYEHVLEEARARSDRSS